MPRVRGSDGIVVEFPEGTPPDTINQVMSRRHQDFEARQRAGATMMGERPVNRPSAPPAPPTPYQRARTALDQRSTSTSGVGQFTDQMFRNMGVQDEIAGATAYLGQGASNLINRAQGRRPGIPANIVAQAAQDREREMQGQYAQANPGLNNLSIAATIPAMAGNPTAALPRMGMLQAGGTAAAINAPFALARQDGSLQERLPGAALETGATALFGAGLQGAANRFLRPALPNTAQARITEFDQAGVRAPLAAVQGRGGAPMAMAISENPIGGNVRRHLQNSVDDVAAAAGRLTSRAGTPEPREMAGEVAQRGVRRFANGRNEPRPSTAPARSISTRDWSFGAKSEALYDDVFGRLARDEQAMLAGQVQGPLLSTTATENTLNEITNRVSGAASREVMGSPMIQNIQRAIAEDAAAGTLRFQDLRQWRTWVREAQRDQGLRQGTSNAALQRLERALTEDIYTSAHMIGGQAANDLRAVDRWYRTISNRINTALQPFDDASGGGQAYRRIVDLASQGGRQNTRQLEQLRASLRPEEWRTLSATVMDNLGRPGAGAANAMEQGAFSLEHFVTNVAKMSPDGRRALFGAQLAADLEQLARVSGYLKGVRGFANYSRSGSSIQNMGTLTAASGAAVAAGTGNVGPLAMLAAAGLTARITGEMLTNPAFVRWLTTASAQGMRRQLGLLSTIAARDPAVAPLYGDLAEHVTGRSRAQETQQPERIGSPQ